MKLSTRLLSSAALATASCSAAAFENIRIVEIFTGPARATAADYIVLQTFTPNQNDVENQVVRVYNQFGGLISVDTFIADVPDGESQSKILVASRAAAARFDIEPDMELTGNMSSIAGAVCFANVDCVSWGDFRTTDPEFPSPAGTPINGPGSEELDEAEMDPGAPPPMEDEEEPMVEGLMPGVAYVRDLSRGATESGLELPDDTDESHLDFEAAMEPTPTNNAGDTASDEPRDFGPPLDGGDGGGSLGIISSLTLLFASGLARLLRRRGRNSPSR